MPVDLLWNGGIGTYVKASDERNAEVGDRTNDAVRINGRELKAKVVGEGGNLGLSQRGRVEYALAKRSPQHRLHRQLRGRQHLGRRGQHQDPAQPAGAERQAPPRRAQPPAGAHDRRSRSARAAQQLPAEPGDQHARAAGRGAAAGVPAPHPLARALRRTQPRARVPAERRRARRAPQERRRSHAAGARDPARLQQDLAEQPPAGLRRSGGSLPVDGAGALLPRAGARALRARHHATTGCGARSSPPRPPTAW